MADETKKTKGVWTRILEGFQPTPARAGATQEEQDRVSRRRKAGSTTYIKGYQYDK